MHPSAPLPGEDTMVASWEALAWLSPGARVVRGETILTALFPAWAPLNNAIALRQTALPDSAGRAATAFSAVGVSSWALWLASAAVDFGSPDLTAEVAGLTRDTTTLVMTRAVAGPHSSHSQVVRTSIEAATKATDDPVPVSELGRPDGVPGLDGWVLVQDGVAVVGAWTYLNGTDCGIYAVGTVPAYRRRGLAAALMEHLLAHAAANGAHTASLQSTPMGEPLYTALGFTSVGRYEEWVPAP